MKGQGSTQRREDEEAKKRQAHLDARARCHLLLEVAYDALDVSGYERRGRRPHHGECNCSEFAVHTGDDVVSGKYLSASRPRRMTGNSCATVESAMRRGKAGGTKDARIVARASRCLY